ncbi:hypothetical protein [Neisseria gonorrhoeae]|uniref:hypothetical protein n=1 Tax=Neisseria gonorrhoeae TaxID=485 RepID=UPI001118D599|nr:hypothetical protein [Neisseria gonorrhoeae]TND79231.1 hypothetical protein EPH26_12805 [Neisseria gonorrhoeae]
MPTLSEKHEVLSGLNRQDAAAIVALIDLKTEDDMEKVLNKLDFMTQNFDARLDAFEKSVDARISSFENSVDARFSAIDTKINAIYWFIGITTTVAVAAAKFL